jgi:hypothetical protein
MILYHLCISQRWPAAGLQEVRDAMANTQWGELDRDATDVVCDEK